MTARTMAGGIGSAPKHGSMWLNVTILASGTVLAQGITILGAPILTRYFMPDEFGVFATVSALAAWLCTLNSLAYHVAIPLAPNERDAVALVGLSSGVSASLFALVAAVAIVTVFLGQSLGGVVETVRPLLWTIPVAVLVGAFYEIARLWNIRQKNFSRLSGAEVLQRSSALAGQVASGVLGLGAAGLVLSAIGGMFLSFLTLAIPSVGRLFEQGRTLSRASVLAVSRTYRRMPQFTCPSGIVFAGGRYAPLLILPWFFGAATTGLYALTERVLQTPMAFVGAHIQTVFLSSCAELKQNGGLADAALSMLQTLVRLGLPTFAILALVAPDAFALVFGADWRTAGSFAQLLTPYIFCFFIALPLNCLPLAFNRQRGELFFQGGITIARCAAIIIGGISGRIDLTIILMSLIGAAGWLAYLFWAMSLVGRHWAVLSLLLRECLCVAPFVAAAIVAQRLLVAQGPIWGLAAATLCWGLSVLVALSRTMRAARQV